ncbi:MAG: flagellar protein FlgN [Candidatus Hydrogenedentes bacterium]|nr:flagellar protein FlgN [Candidatus Hydrogenedentota bacterium]
MAPRRWTVYETLDTFCAVLDEELERQATVLAVSKAQREAITARDFESIEARTIALEALIREAVQSEAERQCVLRKVVEHFDLPDERHTMSDLIEVVPEPYQSRLRDLQSELRRVMAEAREVVRANRRILQQSLRVVEQCVKALQQCDESVGARYDATGGERSRRSAGPALIDQKG